MVAAPLTKHQMVSANLLLELSGFVKKNRLGIILNAPVDVVLSKHTTLQPDIVFISKQRKAIITEKYIHGAPDLVVKILSPTSFYYDWFDKKELYEKHGVKEYWIAEPIRHWVDVYVLKGKKYNLV